MSLLMNYKIIPTEYFKQQVRLLQKEYPHIRQDLKELHRNLKENPKCGQSLGKKIYKIRLKSIDIPKGKRGGYRVITYVIDESKKVRLLTLYAKPKKSSVSDNELKIILLKEGML